MVRKYPFNPTCPFGWVGFFNGDNMFQTEFNRYGMESSIRETSVIDKAEQLIREGHDPRQSYEKAVGDNQ